MQITVDELVENSDKYLNLIENQDIFITRDGQEIARLTKDLGHKRQALKALRNLKGIIPADVDLDAIRNERFQKK